jgi:hypothetical protein
MAGNACSACRAGVSLERFLKPSLQDATFLEQMNAGNQRKEKTAGVVKQSTDYSANWERAQRGGAKQLEIAKAGFINDEEEESDSGSENASANSQALAAGATSLRVIVCF